jgi:hypothetical protein
MKPYRTATRYTPSASDRTSKRSASEIFGVGSVVTLTRIDRSGRISR